MEVTPKEIIDVIVVLIPVVTQLVIHLVIVDVHAQTAILTPIADVIRIMIILEEIVMNAFILAFTVLQEVNLGVPNVQMD
jgi:hypothetical protein